MITVFKPIIKFNSLRKYTLVLFKSILLAILILATNGLLGQKKEIDNYTFETWPILKDLNSKICLLSENGKYLAYRYGNNKNEDVIVITSLDRTFEHSFTVGRDPYNEVSIDFTSDSRRVVLKLATDTLRILDLVNHGLQEIQNVASYKLSSGRERQYLAYVTSDTSSALIVVDLQSKDTVSLGVAKEYYFMGNGQSIVVKFSDRLTAYDLINGSSRVISNEPGTCQLTFDKTKQKMAFLASTDEGTKLCYYSLLSDTAVTLFDSSPKNNDRNFKIINGLLKFTDDGGKLLFEIENNDTKLLGGKYKSISNNVTIWKHVDKYVNMKDDYSNCLAIISIDNPIPIQLSKSGATWRINDRINKYIILQTKNNYDELYWNGELFETSIVNIEDGTRKVIFRSSNSINTPSFSISPDEKYVIWFDYKKRGYHVYETSSGEIRAILENINDEFYDDQNDVPIRRVPYGIAGWSLDNCVYVYSRFDIWKIDMRQGTIPVNLTSFFGANHHLIFRIINYNNSVLLPPSFDISCFDPSTKKNGLFFLKLGTKFSPDIKQLGDFVYYGNLSQTARGVFTAWDRPEKSSDSNIRIVKRMSCKESPNLYVTTDYKNYVKVTRINPERDYLWMYSELVKWRLSNGKSSMGILYKPENFDPKKRYPVIIHYYEKLSDELNVFKSPHLSDGDINISWYVSNGYLVFVPDIQYQTSLNYKEITNSVVSAINELSKHRWFDSSKIGLQGHSFGGYETLSLLTNTSFFKCAQASSGTSDLTSGFFQVIGDMTRQRFYEFDQANLGTTPWDNPDVFIKNSPIFHVNKITTPLLIMHGKADHIVPVSQSIELFTALRRLRKPVWLLQYKNEGHTLVDNINRLDFSIKQQEFFDYYLRSGPVPSWTKSEQ